MDISLNSIIEKNEELICAYLYDNMIIFIENFPNEISNISFNDIFYVNLKEMLKIFLEFYFNVQDINELEDIIDINFDDYWKKTCKIFYRTIIPKRSYKYTFIRKKPNNFILKNKINYLRSIDQPVQRTDEWYS